jgi:NAD(P)-dependent dehydrogenase (short-subunit alcohol dehydrogenase family)
VGKLDGRVAIVTGGGRGVGRAIAKMFAGEGAKVVITGRTLPKLEAVVEEIEAGGGEAMCVATDIRVRAQVFEMVAKVLEEYGKVDILINNAAVAHQRYIPDVIEEEWNDTYATNLSGPFWCIQAVYETMKKNRYGKIISISSTAGLAPCFAMESNYSASKAALNQLMKVVMKEMSPFNVNVNTIVPGVIDTEVHREGRAPEETQKFYDWYAGEIASLGRVGKPDDVAKLALFLASDDSSYISGATVVIDGGRFDRL